MFYMMSILLSIKCLLNFKSKLMVLILMELLFMTSMMIQMDRKNLSNVMTMLLILSIFMVLDSTMGITILMASSRNSYLTMNSFSKI